MNRGDLKKILSWFSLFTLVFVAVILILLFNGYISYDKSEELHTCGDGTFYEDCSLNKPLFCDKGILVEDSLKCGCKDDFFKKDNSCVNSFYNDEEKRAFKYVLDGEEKEVEISVYEEINNYVKKLPRSKFYSEGEIPKRIDFKLLKIEDDIQKQAIQELIYKIQNLAPEDKDAQARIAISLVQNIPYSETSEENKFNEDDSIKFARFPYQVLYDNQGSCEGKSELLVLILRELGYGTSFFYYSLENHEAVGIKCPVKESLFGSGFCFVETTSPSILGDYGGIYLGTGKLVSNPEIVLVNDGLSLSKNLKEYKDSKKLMNIREGKSLSVLFKSGIFERFNQRYGLNL